MSVLIKPIVTEKQTRMTEKAKSRIYGFEVEKDANKVEIKKAVEAKYDVEVVSIRTAIVPPKKRRRFTRTGVQEGKTKATKKAYVTIGQGKEIDFYNTL
ncbi:MAG: 50S ribosomal protein L23 [Bacteroidetes bacterium]|jgi:large subunit ribosomal protein L23|nr:50S ribosomal protein L23 [Bacteroidota bacterium]